MFARATRNFLKDVDAGGDLISVSSLNDSEKAQLLSVVSKKKRFWCWQKPKYHFASLTCMLSDVLTENKALKPVVVESEFVKYQGTCGDVIRGNIGADVGALHMNMAGIGYVESQSSFGTLRKQEVDLQHLMTDVQERRIDLDHPFIKQLHENRNDVLCVLKEKIVTTQKCVITEHSQTEETFGSKLGMKGKVVKVAVNDNGNYIKDENTVLEIPPPTVIAFGVVELFVQRDGRFEFCLLLEKQGGFEKENSTSKYDYDDIDGLRETYLDRKHVQSNVPLHLITQDVLEFSKHLLALEEVPEAQCLDLYKLLCEILYDYQTVTLLQTMVEEICSGYQPSLTVLDELKPSQRKQVQAILHLAGYDMQNGNPIYRVKKDVLTALHILFSSLDEFSDYALATLGDCCKLQLLPVLCALPNITSDEGLCSRTDPMLSDFIDQGKFDIVQRLFTLSNIKLEMNEHNIIATTTNNPGFLPLILYISISGLSALQKKLKT
ncbi:gasdermin-E [Spea bombifrons]|uniref:gasdermin-E n=1 Tax=Spea bombifrons TaxID=233779 RepID=UPI00234AC53B|nr:gasdermin-E [Spea bombifrons]